MVSSSLNLFFADAATAVAASSTAHEVAHGIDGHSSLSFIALMFWAGLVIFARHRMRA